METFHGGRGGGGRETKNPFALKLGAAQVIATKRKKLTKIFRLKLFGRHFA
jgi:hypothetical protein